MQQFNALDDRKKAALLEFAYLGKIDEFLQKLDDIAMDEKWNYTKTPKDRPYPILYNYLNHTFMRVKEQNKLVEANEHCVFNTGLVTENQQEIFAVFKKFEGRESFTFLKFCNESDSAMRFYTPLPERATYFTNPSDLIFDDRLELRVNIDHIVNGEIKFICAPIVGNLSDKYGRRPVLLFSLFGFGIDYIFLSLAPTIWWLFIGRLIAGLFGASFTTATAYIADISTPENRSKNFGMIGAAFGLGFIIGPTLGGILGTYGPRVPFIASAVLTLINWLYGYFILPESLDEEHRRKFDWKRANPVGSLLQLRKYPVVLGLVASLILIYLAAHSVQSTWTFFNMYRFNWDEKTVGYSLGFVGILVAFVQAVLIRYTIPKLGQKRLGTCRCRRHRRYRSR